MQYDSIKNDIINKIIDNNVDDLKDFLEKNPDGKEYIGDAMVLFPMFGKSTMLKYLISLGLDIVEKNLLAECARCGNIELVEYILDALAYENLQLEIYQEQLNKALHMGANCHKKSNIIPILKMLINSGAYFIKGEDTITSICANNNVEVLKLFLKHNFNIMYKKAIEKAITHNCVDVIRLYLENDLLTNEIISVASQNDNYDIIKLVSEYNDWFSYDKYIKDKKVEKLEYINKFVCAYNYKPYKHNTIEDDIIDIQYEYDRIVIHYGVLKMTSLFKPLVDKFFEFAKNQTQNIE
ncbi:repeat protein [Moumouvirus goulette]|uniref:Repeat protein n=1 Tax=Moumouvirus goulette TaxID=1247379 RepID=M1PM89_9VIRU|nr:repeat protein [Moumouvirus goulette]AGF85051.1 repeat protein [Moumouvirus goulette]